MHPLPTAPTEDDKVHTACTAATGTDPIATGVGHGGAVINILGTAAFNIVFTSAAEAEAEDVTTEDPADNDAFPGAKLFRFRIFRRNTFFIVTMADNGTLTHWLDRA